MFYLSFYFLLDRNGKLVFTRFFKTFRHLSGTHLFYIIFWYTLPVGMLCYSIFDDFQKNYISSSSARH